MWCSPAPGMTLVAPSGDHRLEWTWKLEPASSKCGLAMNVAETPLAAAISLTAFLNSRLMSAIDDGVLVREVDLVLAAAGLALGELHRQPGVAKSTADRPDDALLLGRLQDVVVLDVGRRRRQRAVVGAVGVVVALPEEEELDLAAALDDEPGVGGGGHLALQDAPRRELHRRCRVDVDEVDDHHRRLVQPRQVADRRRVDDAAHVAVALVVARPAETRQRRVVEVAGDEVVAVLRPVRDDGVEEELAVGALADHPPEVVGEHGEHRVDVAAVDVGTQRVQRHGEVPRHRRVTRGSCRRP